MIPHCQWTVSQNDEFLKLFEETDGKPTAELRIPPPAAIKVALEMMYMLLTSPSCRPLINQSPYFDEVKQRLAQLEPAKDSTDRSQTDVEQVSLKLLIEMHSALGPAINSLNGKPCNGLLGQFPLHMAVHVWRTVNGYLILRKENEIAASRLLIRPAVEAMFSIRAVENDPSVLYQIFHKDHSETEKLVRPAVPQSGIDFDSIHEKHWQEFTREYAAKFPDHKRRDHIPKVADLASVAGLREYYDGHYRLYCRYTHGALEAVMGKGFDRFEPKPGEDNETMIVSVLCAIQTVARLGGNVGNPNVFVQQIAKLFPELPSQLESHS